MEVTSASFFQFFFEQARCSLILGQWQGYRRINLSLQSAGPARKQSSFKLRKNHAFRMYSYNHGNNTQHGTVQKRADMKMMNELKAHINGSSDSA